MVERSESLTNLAAALARAQGELRPAVKDAVNPHFRSTYADLASLWNAIRGPLAKHELALVQGVSADGPAVTVHSLLLHSSGEHLSTTLTMTASQDTPQAIGSCATYCRRYALAGLVGVVGDTEDDDGNAATRDRSTEAAGPAPTPVVASTLSGVVTVTTVRRTTSGKVKAYLHHSGQPAGAEGVRIFDEAVVRRAEHFAHTQEPVVVEAHVSQTTGQPYVKALQPAPVAVGDMPF